MSCLGHTEGARVGKEWDTRRSMQPLKILKRRLDEARNNWSCRDEEHKTNLVRLVIQRGESECVQLVKCVESVISTLGVGCRRRQSLLNLINIVERSRNPLGTLYEEADRSRIIGVGS